MSWFARFRVFGPIFHFDLMRSSRRGRQVLIRCLYAVALFLVLYTVYTQYRSHIQAVLARSGMVPRQELISSLGQEMSRFAESFFILYMEVQFVGIFLLTPAFTAGAIAEEKERRTLEFLLGTALLNREIVLGKLASRLVTLSLIFLTGLPILSLVQLWGGVDPNLMLAGFAASGMTMLSLASLSLMISVWSKKARNAILSTYLVELGYLGLPLLLSPGSPSQNWSVYGNLFVVIQELRKQQAQGAQLETVLAGLLGGYALFHGIVAGLCLAVAIAKLRTVALRDRPQRVVRRRRGPTWRPQIGDQPLLWKEVFCESGLTASRAGKVILALIGLASFLPALGVGYRYFLDSSRMFTWENLGAAINQWVRGVGTIVALLTLLGVGVRAAGTISGERDKQTLDNLLTSPAQSGKILFAKWLGSILGVRWAWLWLCLIWCLGFLTGGVEFYILPWVLFAWFVYACFVAALGMWFSTKHGTNQKATMWTLVTLLMLFGGHLVLTVFCCAPAFSSTRASAPMLGWLDHFQLYGMTPPVALGWLAFREGDFALSYLRFLSWGGEDPFLAIVSIGVGLFGWWAASLLLWKATRSRFDALANRKAVLRGIESRDPWRVPLPQGRQPAQNLK